jgi:hypothetical protein
VHYSTLLYGYATFRFVPNEPANKPGFPGFWDLVEKYKFPYKLEKK